MPLGERTYMLPRRYSEFKTKEIIILATEHAVVNRKPLERCFAISSLLKLDRHKFCVIQIQEIHGKVIITFRGELLDRCSLNASGRRSKMSGQERLVKAIEIVGIGIISRNNENHLVAVVHNPLDPG
jgi:hypothetical protein